MEQKTKLEQALNLLLSAAQVAKLTAQEHQACINAHQVLMENLKQEPKVEPKAE